MQLTVVDHPLARVALSVLRDESTDVAGFRQAMGTLSSILAYEAARAERHRVAGQDAADRGRLSSELDQACRWSCRC